MEPDILVCREEPCKFGANDTDDIAEHGDQEQASIERKCETSTTGRPDRPFQSIKGSQPGVSCLL